MWDTHTPAAIDQRLRAVSFDAELAFVDQVQSFQPQLDSLVLSYVMRAFESIDLHCDDLPGFADIEVCRRMLDERGVPCAKFWWLQLLAKIAVTHQCRRCDVHEMMRELHKSLPFYEIELSLIRRVGEQLPTLFTSEGTSTIVQLLFADDVMSRWYTDGVTYRVFNALACQAVRFGLDLRQSEPLRVLEVGAGTGGLTSHLLKLFDSARTQYVFTDVGAYFLRSGRRRFADFPFVQFQVFDLERPGNEQGFEDDPFDIVIANNVIHDTRNIAFTLSNITQLMKPRGLFLMLELTDPQIWWHMCFGSLEGWWRFKTDPDDPREELMLLKTDEWLDALSLAGFSQTAVLSDQLRRDFANRLFLSQIER